MLILLGATKIIFMLLTIILGSAAIISPFASIAAFLRDDSKEGLSMGFIGFPIVTTLFIFSFLIAEFSGYETVYKTGIDSVRVVSIEEGGYIWTTHLAQFTVGGKNDFKFTKCAIRDKKLIEKLKPHLNSDSTIKIKWTEYMNRGKFRSDCAVTEVL